MNFDLANVLKVVGPNSALIFAAWIFMGFLQQRYIAALDRYRSLISSYRDGGLNETRAQNVSDQILLYKVRCELMRKATNLGLIAAILLILTLIGGAIDAIFKSAAPVKYMSTMCALGGLALIILAAVLVIKENTIIQRAIDSELLDVPELARGSGQKPGTIADRP